MHILAFGCLRIEWLNGVMEPLGGLHYHFA